MMVDKRKAEKEVWETIKPFLNLPPTKVNSRQSTEGMRQYIKARRIISESVKDPLFVKRVQEHKASFREMLMQDIGADTFAKLFDSDMRACVPNKKR